MRQIEDPASEALTVLQALESLARLAWNDDDVREQVAQMDGTSHATCMIRQHAACPLRQHATCTLRHHATYILRQHATCMIRQHAAKSESVSAYFHKAEIEPVFWQYWAADILSCVNVWAGTQLLRACCEAHVSLQNSFITNASGKNQKNAFLERKTPQNPNTMVQVLRW